MAVCVGVGVGDADGRQSVPEQELRAPVPAMQEPARTLDAGKVLALVRGA